MLRDIIDFQHDRGHHPNGRGAKIPRGLGGPARLPCCPSSAARSGATGPLLRNRRLRVVLGLVGLLAGLCPAAALAWSCTQADSTYSCCLKRHPENSDACGAISVSAPRSTASATKVAAGTIVAATTLSSDEQQRRDALVQQVDEVVEACADLAQAEVQLQRFGTRPLTAQECSEVVAQLGDGKAVTRAMELGTAKHEFALRCVRERLGRLLPGMFSIEQRYLYDAKANRKRPISQEEVARLLAQGLKRELLGSLEPDLIIHQAGNLLAIIAVYDFKFPCPASNEPRWGSYPPWHPYHPWTQLHMYLEAFGAPVSLVAPYLGVMRW